MNWFPFVVGLVFLVALFGWAFLRIARRVRDAATSLEQVRQEDIPALVEECIRVCRERLGIKLDIHNLQDSAENLDFLLEPKQRMRTKIAFEIAGHPGHFVTPLGAFLGELVRTHVPGAIWTPRRGGGLAMDIPQGSTTLTMHPFDKVLKHSAKGNVGDLLTYVNVAVGKVPLQS